jgi:hypothetical protein
MARTDAELQVSAPKNVGADASEVLRPYNLELVPAERFELPTNGLQNRCSTTELCRLESKT